MNSQTVDYLMRVLLSGATNMTLLEELISNGAPYEVINDIYPECSLSRYEELKNEIQSNQNPEKEV